MKLAWIVLIGLLLTSADALCATADNDTAPIIPADAAGVGKLLCSQLDLSRPDLAAVNRLAAQGDYAGALAAWRDYKVEALRRMDPGPFGWHGDQLNGHRLAAAETLTGKPARTDDAKKNLPANPFFRDFFGLSGAPDQPMKADWLARDDTGKFSSEYMNFYFAVPLAVRYWQSGDTVYLDKWFQVAADFARNQKRAVDALDAATQRTVPCNWSTQAQADLSQGDRVFSILRSIGVLVKSLPDGGKGNDWNLVNKPLDHPLPAASRDLIPPAELAEVALSLELDHPGALLERYLHAGAVPNQRRNGLAALLLIATEFPEFKASGDLLRQATSGIGDYLDGSFLPDGGMLEQSLNYNRGDAESLGEMAGWCRDATPALSATLLQRQDSFHRLLATITTPSGIPPSMSSEGAGSPPPLRKDAKTRAPWLTAKNGELPGKDDPLVAQIAAQFEANPALPPPEFTSACFPFSGYETQRLGWGWSSPYLFMQTSRPARGHHNMGCNAIQVTAYGRPLLVTAGPPVYGPEQLPPERRPDLAAINDLFGEESSLKLNTVIVDGQSQIYRDVLQTAPATPIPARWYSSTRFDFMEGTYDRGYGNAKVTHQREVVFVRDPGFWIVTDLLRNSDKLEHTFTQIWNFPSSEGTAREPGSGFAQGEVTTDTAAQNIHTTDPDEPNVWLYHSSGRPLAYTLFFGQRNPYRGWFRPGLGDFYPAAQVFADWKSREDSILVTVIYPTPQAEPPRVEWKNTSVKDDSSRAAFSMKLANGGEVSFAAATGARSLRAGGVTEDAQMLLAVKAPDGTTRGLALGGPDNPSGGEEYFFANNTMSKIGSISLPSGFRWKIAATVSPDYGPPVSGK